MLRRPSSFASPLTVLGLLAAGLAVASGPAVASPSAAATQERALRADGAIVDRDASGHARFVGTRSGQPVQLASAKSARASADGPARAFVAEYRELFGVNGNELRTLATREVAPGHRAVRFQQLRGGLPVHGGQLTVVSDAHGEILSSVANLSHRPAPTATGSVTAEQAGAAALADTAKATGVAASTLTLAAAPSKELYDPALLGDSPAAGPAPIAAWVVEVTGKGAGSPIRRYALVDAVRGSVATSYNAITEAHLVCDAKNSRFPDPCGKNFVRGPGKEGKSGNTEVDQAWDSTAAVNKSFASKIKLDLPGLIGHNDDGAGKHLRSSVRVCQYEGPCPMINAFWNGKQMSYGEGFAAADDVVAHEVSHGITERTSNLVYKNQSGAINESLSDVFGELIDQVDGFGSDGGDRRWQMGEDIPGLGAIRDMSDPTRFKHPDKVTSSLWWKDSGDNGGVHKNSGVGNKAAFLITDGGTFNGQTVKGLGADKALWIYWEVEHQLTSSSQYKDLFNALPQSCRNLAGKGTGGISSADCDEVAKAVKATEMDKSPR